MIAAIDPSLTNTAVFYGSAKAYARATFGSKNQGNHVSARMARIDDLVSRVVEFLGRADQPIELLLIEAYSFGSNDSNAKFSAEYGGLLRWHLIDVCPRIIEVAPTSLKKFATGKGNSKKEQVIAHVTSRYDVMFESNDEYDAYALFRLGRVLLEWERPLNAAQREVAAQILHPQPKVSKSRQRSRQVEPQLF